MIEQAQPAQLPPDRWPGAKDRRLAATSRPTAARELTEQAPVRR